MGAEAIWWRIAHKDSHSVRPERVLRARGEHGTAYYVIDRSGGLRMTDFEGFARTAGDKPASYSEDNANPRRQSENTVTRTAAIKLARDMTAACEKRLQEAEELYKVDPSMRDLYREQGEARFVCAVSKLRDILTKTSEPLNWLDDRRAGNIYGDLLDCSTEMENAFDSESVFVNPWVGDSRTVRFHLERVNHDEQRLQSRLRILFVLGLEPKSVPL